MKMEEMIVKSMGVNEDEEEKETTGGGEATHLPLYKSVLMSREEQPITVEAGGQLLAVGSSCPNGRVYCGCRRCHSGCLTLIVGACSGMPGSSGVPGPDALAARCAIGRGRGRVMWPMELLGTGDSHCDSRFFDQETM